jgi:two-component system, LuxR family, response regulator FixJ
MRMHMITEPTVFIIDDDADALDSLQCLLQSVGLRMEAYSSPSLFLQSYDPARPGCVVLDVRMPEMSGLDLQEELVRRGNPPPIIIVTGHADVPVCAAAFRAGAFDFIEKPANHQLLLGRIQRAIERDADNRRARKEVPEFQTRLERLTPREREVMELILSGQTLKQIAATLGISAQTAAKHRSRVLDKMQVSTDVELVRLIG